MFSTTLRRVAGRPIRPHRTCQPRPHLETLEDRTAPAVFQVTNLNDDGNGSLRVAILAANVNPGPDKIDFTLAGTIQLTSAALPLITGKVDIDGTTAPGFASAGPVVEVDANGFGAFQFNAGSSGSSLRSLGVVNSSGDGVTLNSSKISLFGNFIGVRLDGTTDGGNSGNGVLINRASSSNTIGGTSANQRNVISGNGDDGIAVLGSASNKIVNNYIGTDTTGMVDVGNDDNGVRFANGARLNTLGGTTPLPVAPVNGGGFKPPDGNVISGNAANGVLLTDGAMSNTLAGNFIGTNFTGLPDPMNNLGNGEDGIAILNRSNGNKLLGTFVNLDPFVFYNLSSGNVGNGLRINNSNNNIIHANFFGLAADNNTPFGNGINGVLIEGSSANTQFGGVIPLGNVTSTNMQHGLEITGTVRGTLVKNTFSGMGAFNNSTTLGNLVDGLHITSTGGNNLISTNEFSGNLDDGIEISGNARGVQVAKTVIGMNTDGQQAIPNMDNGIEIREDANNNLIGGFERSAGPFNLISANLGNGIAILGNAHHNQVFKSYIGTDIFGMAAFPNGGAGILLDNSAHDNIIGGPSSKFSNLISGNTGSGIQLNAGTASNRIHANRIGVDNGGCALGNGGNGVFINGSDNNIIGGLRAAEANVIAFNFANGVEVAAGAGNSILSNSIHSNGLLGIDLAPGANNNQGPPTVNAVLPIPSGIRITGSMVGTPRTRYRIQVFADFVKDASGSGEGRILRGTVMVTTDEFGMGVWHLSLPLPTDGGLFYMATATDLEGNTSEFSNALNLSTSLKSI